MSSSSPELLGESSLSLHGAESQIISLLIFIFTRVAANVLTMSGSQVDTFLILLLILFLWIVIRNAMESVADAMRISRIYLHHAHVGGRGPLVDSHGFAFTGEDEGWTDVWSTGADFISQILVLLTFQVAGNLLLLEWTTAGVTTQEALILLVLIAIIFFPIFLWIHRIWRDHNAHYRNVMTKVFARARQAAMAAPST